MQRSVSHPRNAHGIVILFFSKLLTPLCKQGVVSTNKRGKDSGSPSRWTWKAPAMQAKAPSRNVFYGELQISSGLCDRLLQTVAGQITERRLTRPA
jgi:hypothetical protein